MKISERFDCMVFGHNWRAYDQGVKFCDHCDTFKRLGDGYEGQRVMQAVWWILILGAVAGLIFAMLYCVANSGQ